MKIDLDEAPPAPVWPQGLSVGSFATKKALFAELPAVMTAVDDAFQDHWGYVTRPLSEHIDHWTHRINSNLDFDPTVWYIVRDGEEIAGFCLCMPTYDGAFTTVHF